MFPRVAHSQIEARRPPTTGGVGRGVAQDRRASPPWRGLCLRSDGQEMPVDGDTRYSFLDYHRTEMK